ncbi:stage II sporulation protein P [Sporomusa sp.]|uniref:stage II sporulation protein P n=1 Tax=Sporomusa sp. TaxID=2078658 RepID=UPI002BF29D8B|nr:stage II sporulation protein P [Sporomusa sp.]HWR45323.1 stage II sporulation protein P [Sporomusa sp.]
MKISRLAKLVSILALAAVVTAGVLHYVPLNIFSVQQKPEQTPQKVYDYYIIVEEDTGEVLMYVPLVVSIGDELISEENKRYKIVKVEENQAYARFVENLNLELYKK